MTNVLSISASSAAIDLRSRINSMRALLARVPLPLLELLMRIGVAGVFWKSAMVKISNPDLTAALFAEEYRVPLLSPEVAAQLATMLELVCPILLVFGIGARFGAAALLGMTFVIQAFVYPDNWLEHLLWASILLYVLCRGAGAFSADHLVARFLLDADGR